MKKRFIILIDFSANSVNLLKYAFDWSRQIEVELLLVHQSIILTPALIDIESKRSITEQTNDEELQKLKEFAETYLPPSARVSYYVSESHFELILKELTSELFENLIIVGQKERSLLKNIFIKDFALQVIKNTKETTIAAIPGELTTVSHKRILVAVPEKHPVNILELNHFLDFIDDSSASIKFFHVARPDASTIATEKKLSSLASMFANKFKTSFSIYQGYNLMSEIENIIKNSSEDLLIVQKKPLTFTDEIFMKSDIYDLVLDGQMQLIILP